LRRRRAGRQVGAKIFDPPRLMVASCKREAQLSLAPPPATSALSGRIFEPQVS